MSYLAVLVLIAMVSVPSLAQPPQPAVTREVGPPQCLLNMKDRTLTMKFVMELNQDQISYIAGCAYNETSDKYYVVPCDFETIQINGKTYMTVDTVIDIDNPDWNNATNPCGFKVIQTSPQANNYDYSFRIATRKVQNFTYWGDLDYTFTCYRQSALNTYLSTNIDIESQNLVQPVPVQNPQFTLDVVDTNGNAISSCNVRGNTDIRLRLTMFNPVTYSDYLVPYGAYSYNTIVSDSYPNLISQTPNKFFTLIGNDGCSVANNPFNHNGDGWIVDNILSTFQTVVYFSRPFKCLRFRSSTQLWFSTMINTCSGLSTNRNSAADKCYNYCRYVSLLSGGRKRRQSGETPEEIYATITLEDDEIVEEPATKTEGLSNSVLIAITVSVAVFVVALIALFTCFLCYMTRTQKARKTASGSYPVSSHASSDRKLAMKF